MRALLGLLLSTSLALFCAFAGPPASGERGARPNFLFVVVDDQSPFDLRLYDAKSQLDTPVLERLAARGVVLDQAYHMGSWSGAVCTPSRHMIMTGRSVWRLPRRGIRGEKRNPLCPDGLAEQSLAAVFKRAGYDTMRTCKRGNSYGAANAQFDVVHDKTCRGGAPDRTSKWHADRVLEYLRGRRERGDADPFLIYLGFSHPHDPRHGPGDLLAKYGARDEGPAGEVPPAAPPLPANYLPAHPFRHGHPGLRDEVKVQGVMRKRDEATIRNEIGRQFACSEAIDTQVGRVLEELRATGQLDNTYVVYTSDHGMAIGRHGLQGKQNLYEHTWRVPFVIAGPGLPRGKRAEGNVYLLDVFPTLCELAGIPQPETADGVSFRSVLVGEKPRVRDVLYGVYCGGSKPGMRSVRKGRWKLIAYDLLGGAVRERQLFDLEANPLELLEQHHVDVVRGLTRHKPPRAARNLAQDPRHADTRRELEALLAREMQRWDDPYRLWFQPEARKGR